MSEPRIGVVAITPGNVMNVLRAVRRSAETLATGSVELLNEVPDSKYDLLILPGVGHFEDAMDQIRHTGLFGYLVEHVRSGRALIGICLGMQLLFGESEEVRHGSESWSVQGLGFIEGRVVKMKARTLPHIGWNTVSFKEVHGCESLRLFDGRFFYFVHSYKVLCSEDFVVAHTEYDGEYIPAVIRSERVYGIQFHPEKSHTDGQRLLTEVIRCSLSQR